MNKIKKGLPQVNLKSDKCCPRYLIHLILPSLVPPWNRICKRNWENWKKINFWMLRKISNPYFYTELVFGGRPAFPFGTGGHPRNCACVRFLPLLLEGSEFFKVLRPIFRHISFIFFIYFLIFPSYFFIFSTYFLHISSFFFIFLHFSFIFCHISPIFLHFSWDFGTITPPPLYRLWDLE